MLSVAAGRAARLRDRGLLPAWIIGFSLWRAGAGDQTEAMWMAREGSDVIAGSALTHPDAWSWAPQPWDFVPTSPAWEIISATAWNVAGATGLFLLTASTVAGCLAILSWIARSLGATPTATVTSMLFCATIASGIMTSRASLPAFVLLLLEFALAWRWRLHIAALSAAAAIGLGTATSFLFASAGIWLHGSWSMFGVIAIGGLAILLLNPEFGTHRLVMAVAIAVGSGVGMVSGPLGTNVWANGARVAEVCRGLIKEWTSPWQLDPFWVWIWALFALIALALALSTWRRRRAGWYAAAEIPFLLLTVGCIAGGALAVRFLLLGVVAAMPLIALRLSEGSISPATLRLRRALGERAHEPYWRNVVALLAIAALPFFAIDAVATPRGPDRAITALPQQCNLFADDWVTKPVELWRPDIKVWIDGRQDYWGRERLLQTNRYLAGTDGQRLLPEGTTCVLLERGENRALVGKLQQSGRWHRVARSEAFTAWALRD